MKNGWISAALKGPGPRTPGQLAWLVGKGFLMGAADLVPGVSGGTVAFVVGIYQKLLDAVASFDRAFFQALVRLKFTEALERAHLRFLVPLVLGIGVAIFSLARVMHYLIHEHPLPTWGLFFGLICASIVVVGKALPNPFCGESLLFVAIGGGFGLAMVSLIPVNTPESLWFVFVCGAIGITAMILPGLSGSFLLLILGKYAYITGAIKAPFAGDNLGILLVFLAGMTVGLLGFSRLLRYALQMHYQPTMAFLTGLLIGSIKKLWPWKEVLESTVVRGKTRVLREALYLPTELTEEVLFVGAVMLAGLVGVLVVESLSHKRDDAPPVNGGELPVP